MQFKFSNTIDSQMSQKTKQGLPGNLSVDGIRYKYNVSDTYKNIRQKVQEENSGYLKSDSFFQV